MFPTHHIALARSLWVSRRVFVVLAVLATVLAGGPEGVPTPAGAAGGPGGAAFPAVAWNTLEREPVQQWGVVGLGTTINDPKPQVWDFAEIGDRIYVAGTFTGVQRNAFDPTSTVQPRAYLAAFDRDSGDWISSFAPSLDRAVYALEVSPAGDLVVGGEFGTVNGQARTALVALDPLTGAVKATFGTQIGRISGVATVRELVADGADLYVAGTFDQVVQAGNRHYVYQAVRLRADTGAFDPSWLPRPTGSGVWDLVVDKARGRVHLAGYFTSVDALPNTANLATVSETTGGVVGGLTNFVPNDPNQTWTRALGLSSDRLYTGGAQHMVQVLSASNRARLGYNTTGFGCNAFSYPSCNPSIIAGGDYQVIEVTENGVIAGCHCFGPYPAYPGYTGSTHYSSFTNQRSGHRNAIVYDPATSRPLSWFPGLREKRWGTWAAFVDSRGCVYIGGDYDRSDAGLWVGGFGRFCQPVAAPATLTASSANGSATLRWSAPASQLPVVRYRVSRGATFLGETTGTSFTDVVASPGTTPQYRVETVDASRRRSAAAVASVTISGTDTVAPGVPPNPTATVNGSTVRLDWSAASDDQGVKGYLVHRDFQFVAYVASGLTFSDAQVADGPHRYQIRAQDYAANLSAPAEALVTVGSPDTQPPTTPTGLVASPAATSVALSWDASTDDVAVRGYLVHRDYQFLAWVPAGTTYTDTTAPIGDHRYEIRAQDTTANNSAPAVVNAQVGPPDTDPPTPPANLSATVVAGGVQLTWSASI
ncbi:MAG: hypothetical protein OEY23_23815, partial [Acidimicrobiia bacterium]|nr:hypothetical protein [Acidimicrobiia bacterium]